MQLSKHFERHEFACRCGCGYDTVDTELIKILERIREYFSVVVTVNSGTRCEQHNRAVGGGRMSQHLLGKAADITVKDAPPNIVARFVERVCPDTGGVGRYKEFTHVDVRETKSRWKE